MNCVRLYCLLLSLIYAAPTIAGNISVAGVDIEYVWKDGNTIWFPADFVRREQTTETYNLCTEQFSKDGQWEIMPKEMLDAPCILRPQPSQKWGDSFVADVKKLNALGEEESQKPPDRRMSAAEFHRRDSQMLKKYKNKCPAGFTLSLRTENKDHVFVDYAACSGVATIKCKKGFASRELPHITCSATVVQPCPQGSVPNQEGDGCFTCKYGAQLDTDLKRTTTLCGSGSCATRYHCKLDIDETEKVPTSGAVSPAPIANPDSGK